MTTHYVIYLEEQTNGDMLDFLKRKKEEIFFDNKEFMKYFVRGYIEDYNMTLNYTKWLLVKMVLNIIDKDLNKCESITLFDDGNIGDLIKLISEI